MADCNWDPSKHDGKSCPVHQGGSGGNIQKHLKKGTITQEEYDKLSKEFKGKDLETAVERLAGGEGIGDVLNGVVKYENYDKFDDVLDSDLEINDNKQQKRFKTAGIKERSENSKKLLTDMINDFVEDEGSFEDKLQEIKNDFDAYYEGWKHNYPNYQESFTHYLMDSGLGSMYDDDIYDDLIKIGYIDDPKYKNNPEQMYRLYGYNLYNAFNKMLNQGK